MIRVTDRTADGTLALAIAGRLSHDDLAHLRPQVKDAIDHSASVDLIVRIDEIDGVEPAVLLENLKLAFADLSQIRRVAVIADQGWAKWARLFDAITSAEVRYFTHAQGDEAWLWIDPDAKAFKDAAH